MFFFLFNVSLLSFRNPAMFWPMKWSFTTSCRPRASTVCEGKDRAGRHPVNVRFKVALWAVAFVSGVCSTRRNRGGRTPVVGLVAISCAADTENQRRWRGCAHDSAPSRQGFLLSSVHTLLSRQPLQRRRTDGLSSGRELQNRRRIWGRNTRWR